MRTTRRSFLAAAGIAPFAPAAVEVRFPKQSAYEKLFPFLEPGHDEFPFEKDALVVTEHLKNFMAGQTLPVSPQFRGISPMPLRYAAVGDGVSRAEYDRSSGDAVEGMRSWLAALGPVRAARFYVLPDDVVRYEVASRNQYRVGHWKMTWADGKLTHLSPIEEILTEAPKPLFRDITSRVFRGVESFDRQLAYGVNWWRARLDAASGIDVHAHNGIAVGDIDGDGRDEIYICQPGGLPNRLYRNRADGSFEDITEHSGLGILDATASALFVDLRNIGRQDLVVLRPDGPLLFLNEGGNRFVRKPNVFQFANKPQGSFTGLAAADYDRDGKLDLFLCSYSFFQYENQYGYPSPYHDAENGPPNFLFRNGLREDGSGVFQDVTAASGLNQNNNRFSLSAAWCDYDGDGWPDLYVANDFGRNNLYKNEGGKFRDVAAEAGVEDIGAGMSASWFDYDGDGRPDLYVSNMWSDAGQRVAAQKALQPREAYRRHAKGNSLYRNLGYGTFQETGPAEGVEMGRWAWSSDGIDFDNDGTPEIFIAAGMLTNSSEADLESFFWRKIAAASPATARSEPAYENGWNALGQKVHEDHSLAGRQPNVFYVRRGGRFYDFSGISGLDAAEDSRAFAVTDLDDDGNLDLLLKSRLGPQVRVFQNDCGAGRKSIAFRLRGVKSNRDGIGAKVEVDGKVRFLQAGSGYLSQHTKDLYFGLSGESRARLVRIVWPSGAQQEFHDLGAGCRHEIEEDSPEVRTTRFRQRQKIASGNVAGENRPQFVDTWLLQPVVLPERYAGPGFLELKEPLSPDRAAIYTLFCRHLFDLRADLKLPMWFLVDDQNKVHKVYFAPPDPEDLKRMRGRDRVKLALPFAGEYYSPPRRNYSILGGAFFSAGFPAEALPYLELSPQDNYKTLFAIGQIHLSAGRMDAARGYFEKGLALNPGASEGWNNLGGVAMAQNRYADALAHYEKALALRPDMIPALFNAGQARVALGDRAAGEKMFRRILEISPEDADAANQIGELLVQQKRDSEAKPWFQQAISWRRGYAEAINNLGAVYMRMGQTTDAIAAFRYGIDAAPDNELSYLNLGGVYFSLGNFQSAREVLDRLLARKPDSIAARRALRELENR